MSGTTLELLLAGRFGFADLKRNITIINQHIPSAPFSFTSALFENTYPNLDVS